MRSCANFMYLHICLDLGISRFPTHVFHHYRTTSMSCYNILYTPSDPNKTYLYGGSVERCDFRLFETPSSYSPFLLDPSTLQVVITTLGDLIKHGYMVNCARQEQDTVGLFYSMPK